jgi:hypothetical protein
MEIRKYPAGEQTSVELKAHGDLKIQGVDGAEIEISANSNTLKIEHIGDRLDVVCFSDCTILVPSVGKLEIERVGGGATARGLKCPATFRKIGGDFSGEDIPAITIDKVGGSVSLRQVHGKAVIDRIGGDFEAQSCDELLLRKTGGDIQAEVAEIQGFMQAGGDIRLKLTRVGTAGADLKAGSDIYLQIEPGNPMTLSANSGGEEIRVKLGDQMVNLEERVYQGYFGENGPHLNLDAGGSIAVTDTPGDDFEEDFAWKIEPDFSGLQEQIERITEQTTRLAGAAGRRAERAVQRAERNIQQAMNRIERRTSGFADFNNIPSEPIPPAAPGPEPEANVVSNEERLTVLRMLQEKKITLEQAEKLLAVLEGRSS